MSATTEPDRVETLPTARTCARCGYDLRGQTVSRCPECGQEFDPSDPLPAAVPWLHRSTLGNWRAFWETVGMVLLHPVRLAKAVEDQGDVDLGRATEFRRLCALITAGSVALTGEIYLAPVGGTAMMHATSWLSAAIGTLLFAYLASIPIDISGIEPVARKIRFRRLHEFTCAPLVLTPVLPMLQWLGNQLTDREESRILPAAGGVAIGLAWLFTILRFQVQAAGRKASWIAIHLLVIIFLWTLIAWFAAAMGLIVAGLIAGSIASIAGGRL